MANGTIAFDTLSTSGQISGTAVSVDTDYLAYGSAKAWLKFNQDTPAIQDSLNLTSVTDDTTGDFSPQYTNVFSNVGYACAGMANTTIIVCFEDSDGEVTETTTADVKMRTIQYTGTLFDCTQVSATWHGDLA